MSLRLADAGGSGGVLLWHHVVVSGSRKELTPSRQLPNWTPSDTVQTTIPRVATGWGGISSTQPADLQTWHPRVGCCQLSPPSPPSVGSAGRTSTWRRRPSAGAPRTRRPGTSTGRRSRPRCSPSWRRRGCGTPRGGDSPVLPAPKDPSRCLDRSRVRVWWDKAQKLAGLEPKRGRGWHSLRRKFASDLMDQPLKVVCQLGGWKTAQTVLQCYQRADEDQLRKAPGHRRKVRS